MYLVGNLTGQRISVGKLPGSCVGTLQAPPKTAICRNFAYASYRAPPKKQKKKKKQLIDGKPRTVSRIMSLKPPVAIVKGELWKKYPYIFLKKCEIEGRQLVFRPNVAALLLKSLAFCLLLTAALYLFGDCSARSKSNVSKNFFLIAWKKTPNVFDFFSASVFWRWIYWRLEADGGAGEEDPGISQGEGRGKLSLHVWKPRAVNCSLSKKPFSRTSSLRFGRTMPRRALLAPPVRWTRPASTPPCPPGGQAGSAKGNHGNAEETKRSPSFS